MQAKATGDENRWHLDNPVWADECQKHDWLDDAGDGTDDKAVQQHVDGGWYTQCDATEDSGRRDEPVVGGDHHERSNRERPEDLADALFGGQVDGEFAGNPPAGGRSPHEQHRRCQNLAITLRPKLGVRSIRLFPVASTTM